MLVLRQLLGRIFDTEDDGRIPVKDFRKAMEELGDPLSRWYLNKLQTFSVKVLCIDCRLLSICLFSHQLENLLKAADPYQEGAIRYRGQNI